MRRAVISAFVASVVVTASGQSSAQHAKALEKTFDQAARAMQAGKYDEAEREFLVVLAARPHDVAALGNLGVLYSRTNRFAKAIETDNRALKIDPNNRSLLLNLGLAYMKQEQYGRALPYFQRLDELQTGDNKTAMLLATCMIFGDAPKDGIALILSRKLDVGDPSGLYLQAVGYARLNDMKATYAIFGRLLETSSTRAQANFLAGQALHGGHRLQAAADSFEETLRDNPEYPGAHRELGKVYVSMQRFPDAEHELTLAIKQDSRDGSALYFLGAMLVQSAREVEGIPYLTRAWALMPDSWAIPFYLGKAQIKEGQSAAAIPLLQKAASMNGDEPQVFYLLAGALRSNGRLEEAKTAMARVQALHSSALEAEKQAMSDKIAGAH